MPIVGIDDLICISSFTSITKGWKLGDGSQKTRMIVRIRGIVTLTDSACMAANMHELMQKNHLHPENIGKALCSY